jgi:hypothetical protein
MEQQKNSAAIKLKAFLDNKNTKANTAMQQAQKMVNLYRSLDDFGEDFVDQFNKELLEISENAELMLNALIGGNEVRQYLDYLRHTNTVDNDAEQGDASVIPPTQGYLPGPEQDGSDDEVKSSAYVSQLDFEKFKTEQADLMRQLSEQLLTHQAQALAQAIKQLYPNSENLQQTKSRATGTPYTERYTSSEYSEIIEDKIPGSDAIAGFKRGDEK